MKSALPLVLLVTLTAACGGGGGGDSSTPVVTDPSIPSNETGTRIFNGTVVRVDGASYELTDEEPGFIAGEERYLINFAVAPGRGGFGEALGFVGDDVTIYAGTDTGAQDNFSAVSGNSVQAPVGNATFTGHYSIADALEVLPLAQEHGAITLNFNQGAQRITGTSGNGVLSVSGNVGAGGAISGTVSVNGDGATISETSNFFGAGADEVGIGFDNDDFGGYVYGSR